MATFHSNAQGLKSLELCPSDVLDNVKHECFIQALIRHKGNQTRAYLDTYPDASPESARRSAAFLLTKVDIRRRISGLLEAQGLGLLDLNRQLKKLIRAEKAVLVDKNIHYVPDNSTRLEVVRMLFKLHGFLR